VDHFSIRKWYTFQLEYTDSSLYQKLRETKPEYGSNRRIQVRLVNGEIAITNAHVGSLGDILAYNGARLNERALFQIKKGVSISRNSLIFNALQDGLGFKKMKSTEIFRNCKKLKYS